MSSFADPIVAPMKIVIVPMITTAVAAQVARSKIALLRAMR